MITLIILTAGSAIGIIGIIGYNTARIEKSSPEKIREYLDSTKSIPQEFFERIENALKNFWENKLRNAIYNATEKYLIKIRLLVLKFERKLQNTTEWLKGRRLTTSSNGQKSEYWQQISEWKNGGKNENDPGASK